MSNTNVAKTVAIKVNQDKLLANLEYSFSNKNTVLGELMQNARRSGATQVTFNIGDGFLIISDNGSGISDFQNLFSVADSGWDAQTVKKERPFGMGFLSCLYAAEHVRITSNGFEVEGKSSDILAGANLVVTPYDDSHSQSSTQVVLTGFGLSKDEIKNAVGLLSKGFAIPVYVDGEEMKRSHTLKTGFISVEGVGHIFVPEYDHKTRYSEQDLSKDIVVYLQGLPVFDSKVGYRWIPEDSLSVIHLDPELYFARMPDRDKLINEEDALKTVRSAINDIHLERLKALKATLSPEDFAEEAVASYVIKIKGGFELLCDTSAHLSSIFYSEVSESQPSCQGDHHRSDKSVVSHISFKDIDLGKEVLFTAQELSEGDDENCPEAWILARKLGFKLLEPNSWYLRGDDNFMQKHWAAPYIHELDATNVEVEVLGKGKTGEVGLNWWSCEMVLCEAYKLTYTDKTGKKYECIVDDEPLFTPEGFLVPAKVNYIDHAMYQASSYMNNDEFDEAAFDEDERDINVYLNMLRTGSIINTLEQLLRQVNLYSYQSLKGLKFELTINDDLKMSLSEIPA